MIPLLLAWRALTAGIRRLLPYALGVGLFVAAGLWLRHSGYSAGWEVATAEAQAAQDAALAQAGATFRVELAKRDAALAAAQGEVTEVVKWKVRTETVYREALRHDPECAAWAGAAIPAGCGLSLVAGAGDRQGMPAAP